MTQVDNTRQSLDQNGANLEDIEQPEADLLCLAVGDCGMIQKIKNTAGR